MIRTATPLWKRCGGIRIGDLLDIYDNLKATIGAGEDVEGFSFTLEFYTDGNWAPEMSSGESRIKVSGQQLRIRTFEDLAPFVTAERSDKVSNRLK